MSRKVALNLHRRYETPGYPNARKIVISRLRTTALLKSEKIHYIRAICDVSALRRALLNDGIICVTLLALAHVKDEKARYEMLTSADVAMTNWASGGDRKKQ